MKLTTKLILALTVGTVLLYTACKKDVSTTKPTTTSSTATLAQNGQIAVTLYKALSGEYGGASINSGLSTPTTLSANHNTRVIQSVNPLCGYTIDTTYSNNTTQHDTTFYNSGLFKFVYTCNNGTVNGYTLKDSIATLSKGTNFGTVNIVEQNYTSVAANSSLKLFLVNGKIYSVAGQQTLGANASNNILIQQYILTSLAIDNTQPIADILSGTATFTVESGSGATGQSLTGTITFIGNHTAILVVNGYGKYSVNLLTGTTTKL